jgi:peptidoglycan/LPS O-acetylase OafA/YrhL
VTPLTTAVPDQNPPRLVGLDGVRGLAATFVVLHHCWLLSFPGYPGNTGPAALGWLLYGHFAVVVFIALSGFSLAVAPARRDWQLGGLGRFLHRRAWRILPPYWAALAFSLLVAWFVVEQPGSGRPDAKSVAVYGLLLQDVFGANSPNGAFWSIAIEAQLYLLFPLLLILVRRVGMLIMVTAVTVVVVTIGALAPHVSIVGMLTRFTPQFAVLFAGGLAAAAVLRAGPRLREQPWHWFAAATLVPVIALIAVQGPEWTVANFLWIDLALAPAVCFMLAAIATRRPPALVRLLDTGAVRSLGSFSYSLYLIHAPIVVAVALKVVAPLVEAPLTRFVLTVLVALPLSMLAARGFAAVFEIPFTRHRTWPALRTAMARRYDALVAMVPPSVAERLPVRRSTPEGHAGELAAPVVQRHPLAAHEHAVDGGPNPRPLRRREVRLGDDT